MELLKTLDDKELYTRITPFLILMHFIRGNFQQALECYEMLQKSTHKPVLPLFESQLVLQAASSAAYSGHFAHALGMIKSAISTAELEGNIMSAQIFRQHLASSTPTCAARMTPWKPSRPSSPVRRWPPTPS